MCAIIKINYKNSFLNTPISIVSPLVWLFGALTQTQTLPAAELQVQMVMSANNVQLSVVKAELV